MGKNIMQNLVSLRKREERGREEWKRDQSLQVQLSVEDFIENVKNSNPEQGIDMRWPIQVASSTSAKYNVYF